MTTSRPFRLFLLLFSALLFCQCTNPSDNLNKVARKALKDDQGVNATEFGNIRTFIACVPELKAQFPSDTLIIQYLDDLAHAMSQKGRPAIKYPVTIETGVTASMTGSDKVTFDIYYENSASMDGYLNGKTEFIDATLGLMTRAKLKGAEVNLHYINTDLFPVDSIIQNYKDYLEPATVRKFGNRGNSEINRILKTISDAAIRHPDHVSVVISDYIYSIQGKKVRDQLDLQKNTTALSLAELPGKDFAVLIVKINSEFNGTFYDMLNHKAAINEKRPVYFWIIGKRDRILDFPKQYRLDEFKGYETHLILLSESKAASQPYYTVLLKTFREGRFEKADRGATVVTAIENPEPSHKGDFQLGLAVDFSRCAALDDYFSDPKNYEVTSDVGDKFEISEVHQIEDLDNNDKGQKGTSTHILVLKTAGKISKGRQTVRIALKKQMPAWVINSSTESDATEAERKGKTFGLQYLVEGAMMSYDYSKESLYHSFQITIKN